MKPRQPKRILVVYDHRQTDMRLTIKNHLRALETSDIPHEIVYYNSAEAAPGWDVNGPVAPPPPEILNDCFDAVILHYAFLALRTTGNAFFRFKRGFNWIRTLDCLKIAMPQDESDHAGLLDEWLFDWEVDVVFSVHYKPDGPLYPRTRTQAQIFNCLPGYIDETSARSFASRIVPLRDRPYDIIYRARKLSYWYGSHAQMKHSLAEIIRSYAEPRGLRCDISTRSEDAIVGEKWLDFLSSGRAVIGGEGGLTSLDWRGELRCQVEALQGNNPGLTFDQVSDRMPDGWDSFHFLTVTPRHFEAVITKTCQVLIVGDYKGVLEAGQHYLPLKRDFSNLDDVVKMLADEQQMERMVEQGYKDIYLSGKYSYRKLADLIEQVLYDSDIINRPGVHMKQNSKHDIAVASLERQLIAERHAQALLQAQLQISEQQRSQLTQHIAELRTQQQPWFLRTHWRVVFITVVLLLLSITTISMLVVWQLLR